MNFDWARRPGWSIALRKGTRCASGGSHHYTINSPIFAQFFHSKVRHTAKDHRQENKHAARVLDQITRRLPSSFTDRKLYVGAETFLRRKENSDVSVGRKYDQYDAPPDA
eukprot:8436463-Alexandrium_andersonii.AAC.1